MKKNLTVGIDIGGTKTLLVITDENGNILYSERFPTEREADVLAYGILSFIKNCVGSWDEIKAVGIGVCGIVNVEMGIVTDAPAIGWFNVNLRELFKDKFPCPVYVENDVNCCAAGELACGLLKGYRNALYIAVGTGIGGAVVINGNVYRGHAFCAGEIGLTICKHDIKNGKRTDVEDKISGSALNSRASGYGLTSRELFDEYAQKGIDTGGLVGDFKIEMAVLLANAISLLNPQRIVIGGGVAQSMHCLIDDIRLLTAKYTPIPAEIVLSEMANEAAAIGAAMFACGQ